MYASSVWNPYLQGDKAKIEQIQHRATRVSRSLKKLTYEERLKKLDLKTLETRRERGDLIQTYKFLNGIDFIHWHSTGFLDKIINKKTRKIYELKS